MATEDDLKVEQEVFQVVLNGKKVMRVITQQDLLPANAIRCFLALANAFSEVQGSNYSHPQRYETGGSEEEFHIVIEHVETFRE